MATISHTELQSTFNRIQQRALIVGAIGVALAIVGFVIDRQQFYSSYLFAFIFWINFSLGCLGVLMLHHMVSGRWGFVIQRLVEAGVRTLPLMAVLFIPIVVGMSNLYPWTHHEPGEHHSILHVVDKTRYLNVTFFVIRAIVYFVLWIGAALLLVRWSRKQDQTADPAITGSIRKLSAPGIIVFVLTVTFASVDWVMSLEPEWFSSIYGALFVISQALASLALAVIILSFVSKSEPLSSVISQTHYHHLGNLILAFTVLWAYVSLSQFLIIWSGNLPEEIPYYIKRIDTGWQAIGLLLIIFHFAVPFFLLLQRRMKKSITMLRNIAIGILVMRLVDIFWLVMPSIYPNGFHIHWLDLVLPLALGGLWIWLFFRLVKDRPLLPKHDPRFEILIEQVKG